MSQGSRALSSSLSGVQVRICPTWKTRPKVSAVSLLLDLDASAPHRSPKSYLGPPEWAFHPTGLQRADPGSSRAGTPAAPAWPPHWPYFTLVLVNPEHHAGQPSATAQGVPPTPTRRFRKSGHERGGRGLARRGWPRLEFAPPPAPPSPRPPPSLPHSPWRERLTEPGEETAFAAALPPRPALTRASSAGNGEQRWGSGRRPRSP